MKALYLSLDNHKTNPTTTLSNDESYTTLPATSSLTYTTSFPPPTSVAFSPHFELPGHMQSTHSYLLRVLTTCPTRGELAWAETKDISKRHGPCPVPCHDVVGIVTAVYCSDSVHSKLNFRAGDKVMGLIDFDRDGAAAEEVLVLEDEITKIPQRTQISSEAHDEQQWEDMLATIPLAGLTAWQALFQKGELREPAGEGSTADEEVTGDSGRQILSEVKKLLITGASGAVGLLAVQLAIAARSPTQSIDIVAIASDRHLEAVRQLGADFVIPATIEDVRGAIEQHGPFDLVLEMTGGSLRDAILSMHRSISGTEDKSSRLLTSTGKVVSITAPLTKSAQPHLGLSETDSADPEKRFDFFIVRPNAVQLGHIAKLMETGRLRGFVHDEVFSLERGREALEECEKRAREGIGKVVIRVAI